jgi:atypical dual specificity phosphatase
MDGFSFVDGVAAGMPQPGARVALETDLAFLADQDLALLISLTLEPVDPEDAGAFGLDALHLPIPDFQAPTLDQQVAFVTELEARAAAGELVGVHCTAGLGRTGTMLATWFVAKGYDAEAAMAEIRLLRPGSIETPEQEQAVRDFAIHWLQD